MSKRYNELFFNKKKTVNDEMILYIKANNALLYNPVFDFSLYQHDTHVVNYYTLHIIQTKWFTFYSLF